MYSMARWIVFIWTIHPDYIHKEISKWPSVHALQTYTSDSCNWQKPLEERILELVAYARQKKERLSVKDLMGKRELGSPAMLHGRLKSMREKGWIRLEETEDARRKQLELTPAALTHFDKLSRCLIQAVKKSGLL